jgi:hypothetical protein
MSNLRLINETSASSVTTLNITDVFSADFDIYKIAVNLGEIGTAGYINFRLINSSESVVTASNYDRAALQMNSDNPFGEGRSTNISYLNYLADVGATSNTGAGFVSYIFNPYSSSSYTFSISQSSSVRPNHRSMKNIGVLKQTASMSGFQILNTGGYSFSSLNVRTYGLRVDS